MKSTLAINNTAAPQNGQKLNFFSFVKEPPPFPEKRDALYYTRKMPKNQSASWRKKIIVVVGPTASGKSDLGIKLAKKFNGEIISADSRQVYRRMDIGTGKVKSDKRQGTRDEFFSQRIRHHLIDVASPKKQFTADDFKKLGQKVINDIASRNKIPIIVGGTGFYIDVLLGRMAVAEVPPNKKLRARFDKLTVEHLFKMLKKLDPQRAKTIDPKNKRRLVRALEIVLTTGQPVPKLNYESGIMNYDALWIGLKPKNLEKRIKQRLDKRLQSGMIKEVKKLRKQGVSWKRLDDFGLEYRWISRYLKLTNNQPPTTNNFEKSIYHNKLLKEIIKYSKRQMTWFKRNKEINWLVPSKAEGVQKEVEKLLQSFL